MTGSKMLDPLKAKFLVSLHSSGRRWFCNVIGHYDAFLQGKNPTEKEWTGRSNPLVFYGTRERWNLNLAHCTDKIGGTISVPKMFGFRPAIILIRHPAKVAFSHYRALRKKNPELNYTLEEYLDKEFSDFFVEYANKVYKHVGQKNRIFLSYSDLLTEQELDYRPNWERAFKFIFNDVNPDLLTMAINNNSAHKSSSSNSNKFIKRTPANKLNEFYDEELIILEHLKPKLSAELSPAIQKHFREKNFL